MHASDALRDLVERGLAGLEWAHGTGGLGGLGVSMRYALDGGGKRIRPIMCLATAEAAGAPPCAALDAALALELVHTFSLIHDDLPALDNDDERRGRATVHRAFGEGVALLAGDALLVAALRLAATYEDPAVIRVLADATAGMIGGQYLDITDPDVDPALLHRLKTGRLFGAAIGLGLAVAGLDESEQTPWHAFADDFGLLFQIVDDLLDDDGYVARIGSDATRALGAVTLGRARVNLDGIEADTSVLREIVEAVASRIRL